jgi:hypothetical protein
MSNVPACGYVTPLNVPLFPVGKAFPRVGESIAIAHVIKRSADGTPLGLMRADRPESDVITCVYEDGTVRTGKSDVWEVKVAGGAKHERGCKWVTTNPNRGNV